MEARGDEREDLHRYSNDAICCVPERHIATVATCGRRIPRHGEDENVHCQRKDYGREPD